MIMINEIKELKIYRNQKISFSKKENKQKGTIILLLTKNHSDLKTLLDSGIFYNQLLRSVYIPKLFKSPNISKKDRYSQVDYYKNLKDEIPELTGKVNLEAFNGKNVIWDLSVEFESFIKFTKLISPKVRLTRFKEFLLEKINEIPKEYTERIMYIPLNIFDENAKKEIFNLNSIEPSNMLYNLLYYKMINDLDFNNISFLYHAPKVKWYFKLLPNSDKTKLVKLLPNMMNFIKANKGDSFSKDEINSIFEGENETDVKKIIPTTPINVPAINNQIENVDDAKDNEISKKNDADVFKVRTAASSIASNLISKNMPLDMPLSQNEKESILKIEDIAEEKTNEKNLDPVDSDKTIENLEKDQRFLDEMEKLKDVHLYGVRDELIDKRVKYLQSKQDEVEFSGISLKNIQDEIETQAIDVKPLKIESINNEIKTSRLNDMDRSYNSTQKDKDTAAIFSCLNQDNEFPVFVTKIEKEDTSDEFNKKETITVNFKGTDGSKHTFKIDLPIIIDNRFMYINGSKKSLTKQITRLPISKIKPDTVEVTTNYNKLLIKRYGQTLSSATSKLEKFFKTELSDYKCTFSLGDNKLSNSAFYNTLEYDEISGFLNTIKLGKFNLTFNRAVLNNEIEINDLDEIEILENEIPFGIDISGKKILVQNKDDSTVIIKDKKGSIPYSNSLIDALLKLLDENVSPGISMEIANGSTGKRFVYNRVTIISRKIPLAIILGFYSGLNATLKKYELEYEFSEKKKVFENSEEAMKWNSIRFKDGYLYYASKPLRYSLLLNGLFEIDTKEYNFSDFDTPEPYLTYFQDVFGSRNIAKGLSNTISLLLDPITKDILKSMKLPDDFLGIMLYVNTLLETTSYRPQNDITNYRIRGNEQINGYLYYILANAFRKYKDANKSGKKNLKISVPQNELLKILLESPMLDEYSVLNPILEAEKLGSATFKGLSGINLDRAYRMDIRAFDPSMTGAFGLNTPDSDKVGVVRQLTYDPKILNNRGFISPDLKVKDLDATQMFTPAELLSSFTSLHADPPKDLGFMVVMPCRNFLNCWEFLCKKDNQQLIFY